MAQGVAARIGALGAAAVVLAATVASPAAAKRLPVYRDPSTYAGLSRAPSAAPPPLPPRIGLDANGIFPDVLVDEAGTAHIVWTRPGNGSADAEVYCRLPRGASRCDTTSVLTWDKSYGPGDGPQFNTDDQGPKIVRIGDQLVILDKRFPTGSTKPDGTTSSSTVLAWTSTDGGATWSSPAIVGQRNLGGVTVFGPPDDPTILNVAYDPFCHTSGPAGMCVEAYKSGQYTAADGNLSTAQDANYNFSVAQDQGLPVAAFEDLSNNAYIRRWTSTGSILDSSTWTPPTTLQADEPYLAGGPSGLYLMSKRAFHGHYGLRTLSGRGDSYAAGPLATLAGDQAQFGRISEDPSGRVEAVWEQHAESGQAGGVVLQRTTAGTGGGAPPLEPPVRLSDGESNGQIALAAAADGGGFTVFNHTGFVNSSGQIVATGFGNQAPTGRPGIANVPGAGIPGGSSCQKVNFGAFTVDAAAGCFLHGTGANASLVQTGGEVDIDGLRIIADAGAKIVIDPIHLRIDTVGGDASARVMVSNSLVGDVTLWHGEIHRDLSRLGLGSELFQFPVGDFVPDVFGFAGSGNVSVRLEADGVHIPIDLKLPAAFGGFQGHAELVANSQTGLQLSTLHIHIGPVPLGALTVDNVDINYTQAGDLWKGKGQITVPAGGSLAVDVTFAMGAFKSGAFSYTLVPPIALGPFVYLSQIGGGLGLDPTHIFADATLGGPTPPVNGTAPINVNGRFDMTFPSGGPGDFKLSGTVSVFFLRVGDGFFDFQTDGYARFGGHVGVGFGPLDISADEGGFIDATTGQFGADLKGSVSLCADIKLITVCGEAGAHTAVSNQGFAACAKLGPVSGGLEFPWSDWNPIYLFNPLALGAALVTHLHFPCSTDGYSVPAPRLARAADGAVTVNVPAGLPSDTIAVAGNGGAPDVTATGPGGVTVDAEHESSAGFIATVKNVPATYVVLDHPKAGSWTITPSSSSAAITQIMTAAGFVPARVSGRLGGSEKHRTIHYRITHLGHDQSVAFAEQGTFGTRLLGATTKPVGTLRFAPAVATGGRRTVLALVEHSGIVTSRAPIGSYVAPGPPRPSAVGHLRAGRRGVTLSIRWRTAQAAVRYVVKLRGSHGTTLGALLGTRARSVSFSPVRRDERIVVTVQAVSKQQLAGPVARLTVAAQQLPGPRRPGRRRHAALDLAGL